MLFLYNFIKNHQFLRYDLSLRTNFYSFKYEFLPREKNKNPHSLVL